jgi:hypothetical protein
VSLIELDKTKKDDAFISDLRRKAGSFPEELDTDPKFRYAKYMYAVCDKFRQRIEGVPRLINALFDTYADGSIAIRMGGEHSLQLYSVLSEANRQKIGGIIDGNDNCKCKRLGYQIYNTGGVNIPKGITTILLSSYCHLDELREEAQRYYGEYEIIDIYQYLGQHGYHLKKEFYYQYYSDSDWDVGFPMD